LFTLLQHAKLYVASGSDEAELRSVFQRRDLAGFFNGIFGSPPTKIESIHRVKAAFTSFAGAAEFRMLFVGDAVADLEAAQTTGCDFVFMAPYSTVSAAMFEHAAHDGFPVIENVGQLAELCGKMGDDVRKAA
jgi:phosphoglycolate phosphatase-like HAD superfamily hydrolase